MVASERAALSSNVRTASGKVFINVLEMLHHDDEGVKVSLTRYQTMRQDRLW